jgi:acyl-CoA synthetase (AMP-forming)/AMP-acid ligase II
MTGETTFVDRLFARAEAEDAAIISAGGQVVTYRDLAGRVAIRSAELDLAPRSVVLLSGTNSLEFVVTYLALLDAAHVPLLAGSHVDRLADVWHPDAVIRAEGDDLDIARPAVPARSLHPDLALLMSTSGSTGAPKLVRLSDRNLLSNALAIGEYLHLTPGDRGITSLPLHYCYGLSVLHSHLAAGAAVVLTDASVVDPCFAAAVRDGGVTNIAGVPHTYELLERAGPERIRVPTLRFLTQAGGRLGPDRVEQWLDRTRAWGADFFVMYGQTEATARMAYLPPTLARRNPGAIGVPIPGGQLEVRSEDGLPDDVGELVYRGPNVMMGYATTDADLALGATVDELRTGDLGRFRPDDGVFEIVGRRSRYVKPFGVRVDLDQVERALAGEVAVGGDDEHLVVVAPGADPVAIRRSVAEHVGLPPDRVIVDVGDPVPRTDAGKVDYDAVRRRGDALRAESTPGDRPATVAAVFADVLGWRQIEPTSTFVSLGGDSLSYVECSLRLERLLGHLPTDWHVRPVSELEAITARRRVPRLDTTVLLRAVAICAVVSTHMGLLFFPGGAHLLLAVAGFNFSRFQLPIAAGADRLRAGLRTVARAAIPVMAWVAVGIGVVGAYGIGTLLLVNNYLGRGPHDNSEWDFWFIEVFVHVVLAATLVMSIPAVRRVERRFPFGFPLAALVVGLVLRWEWADLGDSYNLRFRTHSVAWFFLLGWLVHRSSTVWQRLITSTLCVVTILGFFGRPEREWFIAVGLIVLVWFGELPFPRLAMRPFAFVAAASFWILITHFSLWPILEELAPIGIAYPLTILGGVAAWFAADRIVRLAARELRSRRRPLAQLPPLSTSTVTA